MDTTNKDFGINTLAELWKRGVDTGAGSVERPRKPYSQVPWVYICVTKILDTASGIGLVLSTAQDDIVESGPAYDFLFANPKMPLDEFISRTVGFVSLYKEAYWVYLDKNGTAPTEILVVGPNQLKPVLRRGLLVGYELRLPDGDRIRLFEEDVHPLIGFNPDNGFRGIGPLMAGDVSISSSYQAALYNEASLSNGARISTVLTVPQGANLSPEEKEFLKAEFRATHGGSRNAGKTFLATGGMDVKTLSQTMAELQMIDLRRFDAAEICSLFGVPPEIVGLNSEAQYAHGPASQRFITDTISPLLSFIARHITSGILQRYKFKTFKAVPFSASKTMALSRIRLKARPTYRREKTRALQSGQNLFAWFSFEDHPAIQEMMRARAEKMMGYTEKGVPLNQVIDAGDLPFDHVPWGDDWWIPMGQVPARYILEGGLEALTGPSLPEGDPEEETPAKSTPAPGRTLSGDDRQKSLRIWQKWVASWLPLEREFKESVRQYLRRQKNEYTKRLEAAWDESKGLTKDADDLVARIQFDLRTENGKLRAIHQVFFERAVKLGAAQTAAEVAGTTGASLVQTAEQVLRSRAIKRTLTVAARKIENTNVTTQNAVARTLRQGLANGESLPDLTRRLQSEAAFNLSRAARVARTNTGSAVSAGRHECAKHLGADLKSWLTSKDDQVRKSHAAAERMYQDGIGIDEPFVIGMAFLMHPGDPNGPVGEVVNCRCMEIVKRAGSKTFDLDHYDRVRMLTYNAFKTLLNEDKNA